MFALTASLSIVSCNDILIGLDIMDNFRGLVKNLRAFLDMRPPGVPFWLKLNELNPKWAYKFAALLEMYCFI